MVADSNRQRLVMLGQAPDETNVSGELWSFDATHGWQLIPDATRGADFVYTTTQTLAFDQKDDLLFATDEDGANWLTANANNPTGWARLPFPPELFNEIRAGLFDPARNQVVSVLPFGTVAAFQPVTQTWHRFCGAGLAPTPVDLPIEDGLAAAVRAGDLLVLPVHGGVFTFDLTTPFCDGLPFQ